METGQAGRASHRAIRRGLGGRRDRSVPRLGRRRLLRRPGAWSQWRGRDVLMAGKQAAFSLAGRTAVITGAASGIGAATARTFASAGANLALAWYPADGHDIQPVLRDVESAGAKAVTQEVDVRSPDDIDRVVTRAADTFKSVDIVVANAGIARIEPRPEEVTDAEWGLIMDVNLN